MAHGDTGVRRRFFSRDFLFCARISLLLLLLLPALFSSLPLEAASLTYDQNGGNLTGFWVGRSDAIHNKPSSYEGQTRQCVNHSGYLGRIVYAGEPTKFIFSNLGPPSIGSGNMFYLTYTDNAKSWRQFFLVIRPWGRRHDNQNIDIDGVNSVIYKLNDVNNYTYDLKDGAGNELADINGPGYNATGKAGTYTGTNEFKYRYKYSSIWFETTMVHTVFTDSTYLTSYGYYTSNIGISTANGANLTLNIEGHYGSTSGDAAPFSYNFSINQDSSTLPYSQIRSSDSLTKALEIASISYFSEVANAKIIVTSDAGGQFVDFKFTADDPPRKTFPFFLAFQSTLHAPTTVYALTEDTCISTKKITHVDKKGRETYTYELGGDIKLYIGQDTIMPATGTYRSTIYFTIEPADTI